MIMPIRLAMAVIFLLVCTEAQAARYSCKSAKELARLGTHDSDIVTVYADDDKRECRFSINGEPAGSPPRDQLMGAMNTLRGGMAVDALSAGKIDWLGLLLTAASPEEFVPNDLIDQLEKDVGSLYECFNALDQSDMKFSFDYQGNVLCLAIEKGGKSVSFGGAHEVEVIADTPYFVVGAQQGKRASYLFIPVGQYRR